MRQMIVILLAMLYLLAQPAQAAFRTILHDASCDFVSAAAEGKADDKKKGEEEEPEPECD